MRSMRSGFAVQKSHICGMTRGCVVQRESHPQYQGKVCRTRRITSAVTGEAVQYRKKARSMKNGCAVQESQMYSMRRGCVVRGEGV